MALTKARSTSSADQSSSRLTLKFLLLICELLLILKIVQVFDIEGRRHFLWLMCLVVGGFAIHYPLSEKYRPRFFLLLSLIAFVILLGWQSTAMILVIGGGLIGVCHLPIGCVWRTILLASSALVLAWMRTTQPLPFWTILGSIFMFRLPIYLREMNGVPTAVPLSRRLSYFFLLPNVCFPFFPLIDYRVFATTYNNRQDIEIAQIGVAWILRGIIHLLLYRLVKYHILPPPEDILNLSDAAMFLAANYALYLRVSGIFHLITGILHLFGFNLPRTHDWYFMAHSFSDIWRRINIYWKDFLSQHIFFPTFFRLRGMGTRAAIAATVTFVFLITSVLHSYQVFWLLGDFPLRSAEAVLWTVTGLVVAANAIVDYQFARRAKAQKKSRQKTLTALRAVRRSFQIVAVFGCVSVFWACWTHPTVLPSLGIAAREIKGFTSGWIELLVILLAVVAGLSVFQLMRQSIKERGWQPPVSFEFSPIPALAICICLLLVGNPSVQSRFHTDTSRVLASLKVDYPTTLDLVRSVPGYYEELADANLQSDVLFDAGKPKRSKGELLYHDITRPRSDLLELELIPRWKGVLAGAPMTINRWGMRDGPVSREEPANTARIAVVGSSVVMGYGVRDHEVFTELLEKKLNETSSSGQRVEVLNFGVGRYYPLHIAAALREKVFAFQPDAVYYVAHQGDTYGSVSHLAKFRFERHELPYPCLDEIIRQAGVTDDSSAGSIQSFLQPRGRAITQCIYQGIVQDCNARGILPVWINLPMPGIMEVPTNSSDLINMARQAGFVVLDLSNWADGRQPAEVKLAPADHHANALGHRIIAERIAQAVRENPNALPSP